MLTVTLSLNSPDQACFVSENEIGPQVLPLPFVRVVVPQPHLIDNLGPLRVVLKKPLTKDFKRFALTLLTIVMLKGGNVLIESSQRSYPLRSLHNVG